jgi:hypothetical protein
VSAPPLVIFQCIVVRTHNGHEGTFRVRILFQRFSLTRWAMGYSSVEGLVIVYRSLNKFFQDKDEWEPPKTGVFLRSPYPLDADSNFAAGYPRFGEGGGNF